MQVLFVLLKTERIQVGFLGSPNWPLLVNINTPRISLFFLGGGGTWIHGIPP